MRNILRIRREAGATRIELGRLWFIRCAPKHPNKWMLVWRTGPEWDREALEEWRDRDL
jgi:hypothetical protein